MALAPVGEYSDRIAVDFARALLEAEGISAVLFDENIASLGLGSLAPVRLMVPEEQAERAIALLDEAAPDLSA